MKINLQRIRKPEKIIHPEKSKESSPMVLNITINALDSAEIERITRERIIPILKKEFRNNGQGIASILNQEPYR